jgi:subtilisin family serine protease
MAQASGGATAPVPGKRPSFSAELGLQFSHAAVLFPRVAPGESDSITYARAAFARSLRRRPLKFRIPAKSATGSLQKIGMRSFADLRTGRLQAPPEGAFASLESLGITLAFFGRDADYANALDALSDQYNFVSDFPLWLPPRAALADLPKGRGRSVPPKPEWPEGSGIPQAIQQGIRGADVLVGVLDTGVDADHVEFSDKIITYRHVSFFPNLPDWPPRDVRGFDVDGHGSHVCGIIAGKNVGVAPQVSLYVASVIESETTRTSLTRVISGLNWLLEQFSLPNNERKPAILNMSLGFSISPPPDIDAQEFHQRIQAMHVLLHTMAQANILVVTAIGNEGVGRINYPAALEQAVGVGAIDFEGKIAEFSGSGALLGKTAKPDLVGYGVDVNSCIERDYQANSLYQRLSGTSMAAPYVTGIAALYRCQEPNLSQEETQQKLLANCEPLAGQLKDRIGNGLARFRC